MPEGFEPREDFGNIPSWGRFAIAAQSIFEAVEAEDPEDTLFVQLTLPELAILTFGLQTAVNLYPEMVPLGVRVYKKLRGLVDAQEYFGPKGDDDE